MAALDAVRPQALIGQVLVCSGHVSGPSSLVLRGPSCPSFHLSIVGLP